jgi:hypothetical protein
MRTLWTHTPPVAPLASTMRICPKTSHINKIRTTSGGQLFPPGLQQRWHRAVACASRSHIDPLVAIAMYALLQSFRQTIDDSTAPLNDAMREHVTAPPPPCSNLGWDVMGEGWLFPACLGPAHLRATYAISCENRGCAHDCLFLRSPHRTDNYWRVYLGSPCISHDCCELVSSLGNNNNHARDMAKFAFLHFSIPARVIIPIHTNQPTDISYFSFPLLSPPTLVCPPFLSLQYQADAQIKPHRLAAAVIDRFDAITTIRYAMPRHVLSSCVFLSGRYNLSLFVIFHTWKSHHLRGHPTHAGAGFVLCSTTFWRIATDKELFATSPSDVA